MDTHINGHNQSKMIDEGQKNYAEKNADDARNVAQEMAKATFLAESIINSFNTQKVPIHIGFLAVIQVCMSVIKNPDRDPEFNKKFASLFLAQALTTCIEINMSNEEIQQICSKAKFLKNE